MEKSDLYLQEREKEEKRGGKREKKRNRTEQLACESLL